MKTIDQKQQDLIESLVDSGITHLPYGILEKDVHVTDVLHALSQLKLEHVQLVFCGGTSLSKAHGLIERMSEDIDLKIVLEQDHGLSGNALKTHLSHLKNTVIEKMKSMGFEFVESENKARNSNRYFASGWFFETKYATHSSLRSHLSLEFTVRTPCYPVTQMPIGYLIERLAGIQGKSVQMPCIAVEETLGEKILSFLRRHAENRAGVREEWDPTLVRHIYDAFCIVRADPSIVDRATEHFVRLVTFDVEEFPKHADFASNPKACMIATLTALEADAQTRHEYEKKLQPLIYGSTRPSFDEAFSVFKATALHLLTTL
jgi:predicted nucleotidyltransferase component of viral defense system